MFVKERKGGGGVGGREGRHLKNTFKKQCFLLFLFRGRHLLVVFLVFNIAL
jgi:hypothetical protein